MATPATPNGFEAKPSKSRRILNPCVGDPQRKIPEDSTRAPGSCPEQLSQPRADWLSRTSSTRAAGKDARSDRSLGNRRLGTRDALFPLLRRVSENDRALQALAVQANTGVRAETSSLPRRASLTTRPPYLLSHVCGGASRPGRNVDAKLECRRRPLHRCRYMPAQNPKPRRPMAVTRPAASHRIITGRLCARSTMCTRCAAFNPAASMSFCSASRTQAAAADTS